MNSWGMDESKRDLRGCRFVYIFDWLGYVWTEVCAGSVLDFYTYGTIATDTLQETFYT
jgi:hypothetical protein